MEVFLLLCFLTGAILAVNSRKKLSIEIQKLKERTAQLEAALFNKPEGTSAPMAAEATKPTPTKAVTETKGVPPPPPKATVDEKAKPSWIKEGPAPVQTPRPPSPPNPVIQAVRRFFTGGNLVVRLGLIVLFFGVSFLLKLAIDQGMIPIEVRLAAVAIAAIALLIVGWRMRSKRAGYALSLIGGAVGVLYLNVFAALRLYHLMPAPLAFAMLVVIVVFSSFLAVVLRSQAIAVLGVCGGFLAPVLASSGGGSHVQLFSYFLVLNLGILAIAWFRAWRPLNLLGFAFTFVLSSVWGGEFYKPEFFSSTEPFLILFFLFYSLIPILFAVRTKDYQKGFVDTTLAFGTPIVGFSLQAALVKDMPHGMAWSSLALAGYYLIIAWVLFKKAPQALRALTEVFLAIGTVFVTLTIPLRLDHQWTSLSWALEGAALVWIGVRQKRILARLFGVLILFGAGFAFREAVGARGLVVLNPTCLGAFFVSFGAFFGSFYLSKYAEKVRAFEAKVIVPILFLWALGWWFYGGLGEIDARLSGQRFLCAHSSLLFTVGSIGLFTLLGRKLSWGLLQKPALLLLPVLLICLISFYIAWSYEYSPFMKLGYIVWPLGLVVHLYYLRQDTSDSIGRYRKFLHAGWIWLVVLVAWRESAWIFGRYFAKGIYDAEDYDPVQAAALRTWGSFAIGLFPIFFTLVVSQFYKKITWPLAKYSKTYLHLGLAPVVAYLVYWLCYSYGANGESLVLPYFPIFNPLELLQAFLFAALIAWLKETAWRRSGFLKFVIGVLLFLWINTLLARSVSHWTQIPYEMRDLFNSLVFQTSLTIYWTILAMGLMIFGTRKKLRSAWVLGACLLGLTVLKMFLVDLSKTQTLARVVSFIGAGILILLIGYFSPLPPKKKTEEVKS